MATVDILCVSSTDRTQYAEYLKKTAEALMTSSASFNWKCVIIPDREKVYGYNCPKGFECFKRSVNKRNRAEVNHVSGSTRHASASHQTLDYVDAEYAIIIDTDIALLKKGWDTDMFKYLKKYACFGIGWGSWDHKYLNFPSIMFISFRSELLKTMSWDLTPVTVKGRTGCRRYSANKCDARVCEVPVGTMLKKDSGWMIPYFFKQNNLTGYAAQKIKVGHKQGLPFANKKQRVYCLQKPTHMSDYLLNGELFATHLQACRSKPFDCRNTRTWRSRIEIHLKDKYKITLG